MFIKKLISAVCTLCMAVNFISPSVSVSAVKKTDEGGSFVVNEILIDGSTANSDENSRWRGFGFISANNSSRLLLDYKNENPEVYRRLLVRMFSPDGPVRISHLKLELGADVNSSSGTEPSTMRSADESANVTRGMGFQLAADAKAVNPALTLELLSWGAPGFVNNAATDKESYELRYQWFKKTLDAAYDTYGLKFDYIDPNYNERTVDARWIKYFSKKLKNEKKAPYDYGKIKIVAADEDAVYNTAQYMLDDPDLLDAVDVIGIHYTSTSDENTLRCKNSFGKELWYSEGLSPAKAERYAVNAGESGISGINSMLDVAGRIVNMYPNGGFTMYEFQPAIAAYYNGANYFPKQLVTANEPWSGYTEIGAGMYMCEHFSLFSREGWQFVDSACYGDGIEAQHVLTDTTNNYLTLTDPETGDYSTIFVNNTGIQRSYSITVKNLSQADKPVDVWETRGPDPGNAYNSNYMKNTISIEPTEGENGEYTYKLTVKPYSMLTLSTLKVTVPDLTTEEKSRRLTLPYTDNYEYDDHDENYLSSRGYAPRYTTDIGGAFEVVKDNNRGHVLRQVITNDIRGREWGATPDPVTTFGDDTWANYGISTDVKFDRPLDRNYEPSSNYVGVGLRYVNGSAAGSKSGYWLKLGANGTWSLNHMMESLAYGTIEDFDVDIWHKLSVTAAGNVITAAVDNTQVAVVKLDKNVSVSGRAAFYSAYYKNSFDELNIVPLNMITNYAVRLDELDSRIVYEGEWEHNTMASFTNHNRTVSTNVSHSAFSFNFEGDSLALIGSGTDGHINVEIDGKLIAENELARASVDKAALWFRYGLDYGEHEARISVVSGTVNLDAVEYGSNTVLKNGDVSEGYLDNTALSEEEYSEEEEKKVQKPKIKNDRRLLAAAGLVVIVLLVAGHSIITMISGRRR
ncbi:MAG: glycosyl hydrolase family 59 [Ruminococcus sp.]|nr:glycosyl hydrolase family 59 [Ruminococcus sp.]